MVNHSLLSYKLFEEIFKKSDPLQVLENERTILSCYENLSNQINDTIKYDARVKFKLDLLENYLIYLAQKNNPSVRERIVLNKYKKLFAKWITNPKLTAMCYSKIYKYINLFGLQDNPSINNISTKALNIFHRFTLKEKLSNQELNYMFCYFTNFIDSSNPVMIKIYESLATWLIKSDMNYGIYSKTFLLHFLMHEFCKENNFEDVNLYITDTYLNNGLPHDLNGLSISPHNIVSISYNLAMKDSENCQKNYGVNNSIKIIHTLFHELQHIKQFTLLKNNTTYNTTAFIAVKNELFNKYLSTKDNNEYFTNYENREIEREANIGGWINTFKVLSKYASERKDVIKMIKSNTIITKYKESIAHQTNIENNISNELEFYNVRSLIKIISKNPFVIKEYPILTIFFNKNGEIKDLKSLVITYQDIINNNNMYNGHRVDLDIFNEFFKVLIKPGSISHFNHQELRTYEITWFNIIYKLFKIEIQNINQITEIKKYTDPTLLKYFTESHFKFLNTYYHYLIHNKDLIDTLKRQYIFEPDDGEEIDFKKIQFDYNNALSCTKVIGDSIKGKTKK